MSLTTNQSTWLSGYATVQADFVSALTAALEADNDTSTTLADARTARAAFAAKGAALLAILGVSAVAPFSAGPAGVVPQRATNVSPVGLQSGGFFPN